MACDTSKMTYSSVCGTNAAELRDGGRGVAPVLRPAAAAVGSGLPGMMMESKPAEGEPREPSRRTTVSVLPTATRARRRQPQPPLNEWAREA